MKAPHPALSRLATIYRSSGDAVVAEGMSAYMKGLFPFVGIKKPQRAELSKPFFTELKNLDADTMRASVRWLWKQPEREFQYFAMELLWKNKKAWEDTYLELFEELVESKSWWDTVDFIAATLVGHFLTKHPKRIATTTKAWCASGNMWLNRTAILFQLKYKDKTDFALLQRLIEPHRGSKEFFHQKAIGWSLRQYAYTDPKAVVAYVKRTELKPLSRREAMKHLG